MQIQIGSVVVSKAGHDTGEFFAVMKFDEKNVFISDGKQRKVEKPKKKNLKHVSVTRTTLDIEQLRTNRQLKKALASFQSVK